MWPKLNKSSVQIWENIIDFIRCSWYLNIRFVAIHGVWWISRSRRRSSRLYNGWPNRENPFGNTWNLVVTNKNKSGIGLARPWWKTEKEDDEKQAQLLTRHWYWILSSCTRHCIVLSWSSPSRTVACRAGDATAIGPRGFCLVKEDFQNSPPPQKKNLREHWSWSFIAVIKDVPDIGLEWQIRGGRTLT